MRIEETKKYPVKTTIFIETTRSSFSHQAAHFIHSPGQDSCKNIFVVKHTTLNPAFLSSHNASVIRYNTGELQNTLTALARVIVNYHPDEINVHVDAGHASLALLVLASALQEKFAAVRPHIYETRLQDYVLRTRADDKDNLRNKLREALENNGCFIGSAEELRASAYCWHDFTHARYYLEGDRHSAALPVGVIPPLDEAQKRSFAALLSIPEEMINTLRECFQQPGVFYCCRLTPRYPFLEKAHSVGLTEQLSAIRQRQNGHPFIILADRDNNAVLMQTVCDQVQLLPSCLSFSAMKWLGINPENIITTFQDDIATLTAGQASYIISTLEEDEAVNDVLAVLSGFNFPVDQIYYTRELQHYYRQGNVKRIFYSSASMGDIVYGIGAINALRHYYPDDKFVFVTHKLYASLIENCPCGIEHWDINRLDEAQRLDIEIANRFSRLHFFERWEQIVADMHMTDAFIKEVTPEVITRNKNAVLDFACIDNAPVDAFMRENGITSGKVALLHPNIGSPNRTWSKASWERLAERFVADGWQVILIGSDTNKYASKKTMPVEVAGVFNAINRFTITQTVYLMSLCQLLVACDSGPVALAGYTDIAISALYSIIPSRYRLPYRHGRLGWNAQGIDTGCRFGQCGHLIMRESFFKHTLHKKWSMPTGEQFAEWCPESKKYACLKQVSDADWWTQIQRFIASDAFVLNTKTPGYAGSD